jgi:hypothetical protein
MKTAKKSMTAMALNTHNQPKGTTKMKKMTKAFMAISLTAATFTSPLAYAASDYKVIKDGEVRLGDDADFSALAKGRFSFTLPDNYDNTQKVVLQMRVRGAAMPTSVENPVFTKHSVYLNPTNVSLSAPGGDGCREDSEAIPDLPENVNARINRIESHRTIEAANEAFLQHQILSGSKFNVGSNLLVICPRDSNGRVDTPGNSADNSVAVDDFSVSEIVLQFKTK